MYSLQYLQLSTILESLTFKDNQLDFDLGRKEMAGTGQIWIDLGADWLAANIEEQCAGFDKERARLTAYIVTRAIQGCCMWAINENPERFKSAEFKLELKAMVSGYLSGSTLPPIKDCGAD